MWLQALAAVDLDLSFTSGKDFFGATQEMSEEFRQEVTYQGAFGKVGPVIRRKRPGDEGTISFSAILLRPGASRGMASEEKLRSMTDFDVTCKRGNHIKTYTGCNWSRITIRSTLDQVTLDCDITLPGYEEPIWPEEMDKARAAAAGVAAGAVAGVGDVIGNLPFFN